MAIIHETLVPDISVSITGSPPRRRFGKSADADMLIAYYTQGAESRVQLESLKISRNPSFDEHLNAHDVITMDIQRIARRGTGKLADSS